MNVFAAFVPPREILDDLWSAVGGRADDDESQEAAPTRRRVGRRRQPTKDQASGATAALEAAPVAHANVLLAKFGNLAVVDANRLAQALTRAATEWSSPRLQLRGYTTLEAKEDPSIWANFDGDIDALNAIARGVPEVAGRLGMFVDRRLFQPRVRLGSVSPKATEAELETVLAKLALFETNKWWQTRICLFTPVDQGLDQPSFKVFADIPLGPHVVH